MATATVKVKATNEPRCNAHSAGMLGSECVPITLRDKIIAGERECAVCSQIANEYTAEGEFAFGNAGIPPDNEDWQKAQLEAFRRMGAADDAADHT